MNATIESAPKSLEVLKTRWIEAGRPVQSGIDWPRNRWIEYLPAHAGMLSRLPDRLGRHDIREIAADAAMGNEAALDALIASMAWGYGNVGYAHGEHDGYSTPIRRPPES